MKHKDKAIILLAASMILVCVTALVGVYVWSRPTAQAPDQTVQEPAEDVQPEQAQDPAQTDGAQSAGTASGGGSASAGSGAKGPTVPEQDGLMGPAYFADAAFLGNEITSGLWLYNNDGLLPSDTGHWFCSDGLTVLGASPYAAQMPAGSFGKIYIGLGIHEVNYEKKTLLAAFDTVLDQIQASQPDAIIYLMSVTPVSKYCDENLDTHRSTVQSFNSMLQDIARERGVWYLDVYPVLCGEDGYLPSEETPDGITFSPAHYQKWFEYMQTHYVPDGTPAIQTQPPESSPGPESTQAPESSQVPESTQEPAVTDAGQGT